MTIKHKIYLVYVLHIFYMAINSIGGCLNNKIKTSKTWRLSFSALTGRIGVKQAQVFFAVDMLPSEKLRSKKREHRKSVSCWVGM